MDFDLRELEIFCAVVERQSFTRAAAEVHLTQASVSERIANLEREVGARLLNRSRRGVSPTAVGLSLYDGAKRLLAERQSVVNDLADMLGLRGGKLIIGASTIPGEYLLPNYLASFKTSYPGVRALVQIGGSQGIADMVRAGTVEIGFVSSGLDCRGLVTRPMWSDELVVAVSAEHPWAGRDSVQPDELLREPLILRERGSGTRKAFERAISEGVHEGPPALVVAVELGSTTAAKEAVLRGLGVSILSSRAIEREVDGGLVATCRVSGVDLTRSIDLMHHHDRTLSPAAARFIESIDAAR